MKFSLFFFSSDSGAEDPYRLMIAASRYADANGFRAVWTPERHFDRFGGAFAHPAITSAALAMVTERIELRSGSLISPLHDVIRIAEAWAMVDQLSRGRAAISFGSGWNANDFVFFPERYERRGAVMYEQIDELRRIWRGEPISRQTLSGPQTLEIFPKPVRRDLPVWITTSGSLETWRAAGARGTNVLTHMMFQDLNTLRQRITEYREARRAAGFDPRSGVVSLMLHTFVGPSDELVRAAVRPSMREYLRAAVQLEIKAAKAGKMSGSLSMPDGDISDDVMEDLLDLTFERYYRSSSCMGTVDALEARLRLMNEAGVDEIACLIDFGVERGQVLEGLDALRTLKRRFDADA
ncbi:MupA/Atu3671 family FMN-dependent luciferase-like monooxygenase [Sorangium sp. So ce281]|uniref:MupA/Atu3671 family FMN-dependent luciferase-like monooxygenase n=1 Tax=unclassified Sorangium TaxID=2621164 RepID=UPI003F632CD7